MRTKIKAILTSETLDYTVTVKGWVRSFRNNQFIALNDGSCVSNLQIVIALETDDAIVHKISGGAAIEVTGTIVASLGKGQRLELKAATIAILGECEN
ncbi:MAG: OB-fold nucleic acid binding domain-containing protein, partial [Chitinophagaceae bacterium]